MHLSEAYTAAHDKRSNESLTKLLADKTVVAENCPIREKLLAEIAVLRFRAGHVQEAERSVHETLQAHQHSPSTYSSSAGTAHFLLAPSTRCEPSTKARK
jgi:hypothetical protein